MCPWKFLTLRTVAVVQGLLSNSKQRSFTFLSIVRPYDGKKSKYWLWKRPCTTATVPEVIHFQGQIFLSYHHTVALPIVAQPSVVPSEICFSALNLKKRPCTMAKVPKVRHFKEIRHTIVPMRNLRSYNLTSEVDSDFEKKALYNGNSARGQPFSRAPSYTIFKGHRFEGRHWRRQRWRSRLLSSTQGRLPPSPLPHHRQWLFWPFSFVLANGKKIIAYIIQGHC